MKLTIEQALQQGIGAHKEGKLEEAERLYRAILQSQPLHPDANHNLGVLAVSVNKADAALPLFKTALEANPKIEQFWLSYIDALIKTEKVDDARQVIEQAKKQGVSLGSLHTLELQLKPTTPVDELKSTSQKKDLKFKEKRKKLSQQKKQKKATRQNLKANNPPQSQINNLLENYQNGRFIDAEKLAVQITQEFPKHQFSWKVLGTVLGQSGRHLEAINANQEAVALSPQDPEAQNNLGNTFKELGKLDEAEASYNQAIGLQPDLAGAHYNLGNTLKGLGRSDEAEASYTQAIALEPDFAKTYDHLGSLLQKLGKFEDAEACYKKYISLDPFEVPVTKSMASTFFSQGEFQKSLSLFDSYNTMHSRTDALKCLYALGKTKEIYKRIEDTAELDDGNLHLAAFSSFIAESQKKVTAHRFCKKPLEFLHFTNLSSKIENSNSFITDLIKDLGNVLSKWQPPNQSAVGGFQTAGDLFRYSNSNIVTLKAIILHEIDLYYEKFQDENCSFMEKWPNEKNIIGWHMRLKEQGYHNFHIHQSGWLSGVIYLKVVPSLNKNEGAIKFSVTGPNISDSNLPEIVHNPAVGDMILFPSSLYHGTIPFSTDTDRIVVSFDLKPSQKLVKT